MKSLYESLKWEVMVCESFADPRLYQISKDLKDGKTSWNDVFKYRLNVAWDKIQSSDIEEFEQQDVDDLLKQIRKASRTGNHEREFVVFGFKREHIYAVYLLEGVLCIDPGWRKEGKDKFVWFGRDGRYKMNQTAMFDYLKECDYTIKVYIDKYKTGQLKLDRQANIKGSWQMSTRDHESIHKAPSVLGKSGGGISSELGTFYSQCRSMANEARKKWKEILAERKFTSNDTTEIDKLMEDVMTRLPKACINATKDPVKYDSSRLEKLMKLVYDKYSRTGSGSNSYRTGNDELLVTYQNLCQDVIRMKKGDSIWLNKDQTIKEIDQYKKIIQDKYNVVDELLKYFDV